MKSLLSLAVGIMLVVASGLTAAHAQDKANAALDKKVTLDLVDMPLKDVAEYLKNVHKVDFVLGPGVDGKTQITCEYKLLSSATHWKTCFAGTNSALKSRVTRFWCSSIFTRSEKPF